MRLVPILFVFLVSNVALAKSSEWVYKGYGEYKEPSGFSMKYSSSTSKAIGDDHVLIVKNVIADGHAMTVSAKLKMKESGLIDVLDLEENPIGSGYYFIEHGKKIIHYNYIHAGYFVEKTLVGDLDGYKEIGSVSKDAGIIKGYWIEKGKRVFPFE